jgi:hypothetical protein
LMFEFLLIHERKYVENNTRIKITFKVFIRLILNIQR